MRRIGGEAPGLESAGVRVVLDCEQDSSPSDVLVAFGWSGGVPAVPGQLAVAGVEELFALLGVLADEQHVRRRVGVAVRGVVDPGAEKRVVAAELVVVLVDASGAVVFDEQRPGRAVWPGGEFEDGVGAKRPRAILAGDYNAHPEDVTITKLTGSGLVDAGAKAGIADEFTYSSGAPHERIDYVFVSPDVTPVSARVLEGTASDHRPVLVVVRLR